MKILLYFLLAVSLCFTAGGASAADQNQISRDEFKDMKNELQELKTLLSDMNDIKKEQAQERISAPNDSAAAPCYENNNYHGYHSHHYNH